MIFATVAVVVCIVGLLMPVKLYESKGEDPANDRWFFWCPGCRALHAFDRRWTWNGSLDKPTFRNSLLCHGFVRCHSYVTDGKIEFLADCGHELKGTTVEIPEWNGFAPEKYSPEKYSAWLRTRFDLAATTVIGLPWVTLAQ